MRNRPLVICAMVAVALLATAALASFEEAVTYFEKNEYRRAVAELERQIGRGDDSARVRTLLGWSLYKAGDLPRARGEFDRALALNPSDPNAFYAHEGLGWIAYRAGDHDRAVAAFGQALRLNPGYHNAHAGLGWAYLAKKDFVRAEANFTTAKRAAGGSDSLDPDRGLAFVAHARGDWKRAIERFRDLVRRDERDSVARSALAWATFYRGDTKDARRAFEELAKREPTWADPLAGLAWVAEREGRTADAKAGFRAALAKSASYVATREFDALLAGRPEWLDLWHETGWALYHQRVFGDSEREFRALLERHPRNADALRGLGYALYMLKRYREAIPPLQQSLALDPKLPPVQERVEIPGAAGLHPITSDARSTLAWSYFQAGDYPEALKHFREVTQRHPDWADPFSGLGWTLSRLGDRPAAEQAFRQSLQITPRHADALMGLRTLGKKP
jgi:tetratricopeptide (TPR) repeat protein